MRGVCALHYLLSIHLGCLSGVEPELTESQSVVQSRYTTGTIFLFTLTQVRRNQEGMLPKPPLRAFALFSKEA